MQGVPAPRSLCISPVVPPGFSFTETGAALWSKIADHACLSISGTSALSPGPTLPTPAARGPDCGFT